MYEYLYVFSSGIFLPHHSVCLPDLKKKLVLWSLGFSRLFCCQCMGVGGWGDEDWITLNFLPDTFHLSRTQIPGLPALQFPKYQEFSGKDSIGSLDEEPPRQKLFIPNLVKK